MRSLTLGSALLDQGCTVSLMSCELVGDLPERSERLGIPVVHLGSAPGSVSDAEAMLEHGCDLAVIDGYFFTRPFFEALDAAGLRHAVIDDNGESDVDTAIAVLNQNLHADPSMYGSAAPKTRLLLGPRYALIRSEVRALRNACHARTGGPVALIAIGGTDALGLSGRIAEHLAGIVGLELVVAGASAPPGFRKASPDIAQDLGDSTVAVIGAGTTMWEACCLGVPAVALVVADNQVAAASAAHDAGVVRAVDCRGKLSLDSIRDEVTRLLGDDGLRSSMSRKGRELIDGEGARRVAEELMALLEVSEPR